MTKIKICGLRRIEDIEYANRLRPDYVGFVFSQSKRIVSKANAKTLIANLDAGIKRVGVFVDENMNTVCEIVKSLDLDVIQLHGDENASYVDNLKKIIDIEIWKVLRVKTSEDLEFETNADKILIESFAKGAYGGTGISFDWNLAEKFEFRKPLILAGGLNASNVEEGIRKVRPYAVDVSSGVETDGYKDFEKMKEFIEKVRSL
ncbi:MAG: phosphoribosylanthranilate isomerase [Thermotogae bacterium]|jgi:phosphoribosylanthranilate isomerase|nr:phosphoribosylanthranilate isomerase [Thermotogota bacterium]